MTWFQTPCHNSAADRGQWLTCGAGGLSIDLFSSLTCCFPGFVELTGNLLSGPEVHLIGRLAAKCRVGKTRVVLFNVERYELPHRADRVERVQIKPLMFEHPPPGLDRRISILPITTERHLSSAIHTIHSMNKEYWFCERNKFVALPIIVSRLNWATSD